MSVMLSRWRSRLSSGASDNLSYFRVQLLISPIMNWNDSKFIAVSILDRQIGRSLAVYFCCEWASNCCKLTPLEVEVGASWSSGPLPSWCSQMEFLFTNFQTAFVDLTYPIVFHNYPYWNFLQQFLFDFFYWQTQTRSHLKSSKNSFSDHFYNISFVVPCKRVWWKKLPISNTLKRRVSLIAGPILHNLI